jgi:hypothetical protein
MVRSRSRLSGKALASTMANPLREVVKHRFYPFAESRGFVRDKSSDPLFTTFRRTHEGAEQVFDIQWDKYHRPFFVINFRSPEGSQARHKRGRLQRRRGGALGCWFTLRKPLGEILRTGRLKYEPVEVVDQLISYFGEVEEWWSNGAEGPHIYFIPLSAG